MGIMVTSNNKNSSKNLKIGELWVLPNLYKMVEFSLEGYYKKMRNLITYKEGASYHGGNTDWQDKIESQGKGISYGVELLIQKKEGRATG